MSEQFNRDELEVLAFNGETHTERALARMLLAGMDSKPLAVPDVATPETVQALSGVQACFAGGWAYLDESQREIASDVWNACRAAMLKAAPPAPVAVPDFDKWSRGCKIQLLLCYSEFREVAQLTWNEACAAMLKAGPVTAATVPDGWTANADANDALVMLDRIDTVDCDDDERIESVKNIIRRLAAAPVFGNCRGNENSPTNNFRESAETSTNCPCCGRKPLKNKTCSVSGCDGKHVARGFCMKHYSIERKKEPSRRESIRSADKRYRARKAAAPEQGVK